MASLRDAERPAHDSPRIPDSPAGFLESWRGRQRFDDNTLADHVDRLFLGCSCLDDVQKPDEFLMAMALHALADNLALKNIEQIWKTEPSRSTPLNRSQID